MSLPLHNTTPGFHGDAEASDSTRPADTGISAEAIAQRLAPLVHALCPDAPPLDAPCLRRMAALLRDPDWHCDPAERNALQRLLAAAGHRPASAATLQDLPWPALTRETDAYAQFERARRHESEVRRQPFGSFGFSRHDWETAQKAALRGQLRQVRDTRYVPMDVDFFRIH